MCYYPIVSALIALNCHTHPFLHHDLAAHCRVCTSAAAMGQSIASALKQVLSSA
jgi:hypothetical protein